MRISAKRIAEGHRFAVGLALFILAAGVAQATSSKQRTVSVSPSGGDYTTLKGALDAIGGAITTPTFDDRLIIEVHPQNDSTGDGDYDEDNSGGALVVPKYVAIIGIGADRSVVKLQCTNDENTFLKLEGFNRIVNLTLQGEADTGQTGSG